MTEVLEPKEETKDFDAQADEFFEKNDKESSALSKAESEETEEVAGEKSDDDQLKKSEPKEETDETDGEDKNETDPKDLMFRKGYNKAKEKWEKEKAELLKDIPPKEQLETFNKTISSPSYIRESMKSQGYTEEAINAKLRELGHNVEGKPADDMGMVLKSLNIDLSALSGEQKDYVNTYISDVTKVARIIAKDEVQQALNQKLSPLEQKISTQEHNVNVQNSFKEMKNIVKEEGILDFDADVRPELNKLADEAESRGVNVSSPEFLNDLKESFREINHRLSVERLRTKGKKQERDEKKGNLRTNKATTRVDLSNLPEKTGDFDKDAEAFFSAREIR